MTRRYFFPDLPPMGGPISLPDTEAQHAARVMRVQIGQSITLFDGKGHESEATVTSVTKRECHCQAHPAEAMDRESSQKLHLGIALPKPDRARELIERLTELGVWAITPLVAERTQRAPSDAMMEKLARGVIESSKQCGRNHLMRLLPPTSAQSFFQECGSLAIERWIAHPQGSPLTRMLREENTRPPATDVLAAVGPEGGWSDAELDSADNCGFVKVGLGKRIYRIETAATVIASLLAD